MGKQLIIGFGTGRSGTTSLSAFLNAQERTCVLHEGRLDPKIPANPFAWQGDDVNVIQWIDGLLENNPGCNWIGDIGMYYINYVDVILDRYPDTRFICMQRPQREVVQSYLKWTPNQNHWMIHDGAEWKHTKWDKAYPKFDVQDKEEALNLYWLTYASLAKSLQERLPASVKIFTLEDFNQQGGREAILDFIQYTGARRSDFIFQENTTKARKIASTSKRLKNVLWAMKRRIIGSPGHRWFLKKAGQ